MSETSNNLKQILWQR